MEVAAATAGFVSLAFQTFQGCVQAFDFFYTAQHIGVDGDLFAAKLAWEQYRLIQWGKKAGLEQDSSPKDELNWQLAYALLQQLEALLTSAEKLKQKYRLDVTEEDVSLKERSAAASAPSKGIGKFIARLRPETYTIKGQIIQTNNNTLKRLRWATFGKEQANSVMREIADLNSKLNQLLDSLDRERRVQVDGILLRDILSRSSTASEVESIKQILEPSSSSASEAIRAAATLKQIRLYIGNETREDEVRTPRSEEMTASMPAMRKCKPKKLKPYLPDMPLRYKGIEFAKYEGNLVLMEWKTAAGPLWEKLYDQVRCLAILLASPASKSSQALHCIATLPWQERELFALVYEIPKALPSGQLQLKSLYDLILQQPQLSLGRRFEVAKMMAEAVLHLHTAGWLHKSLRSENIIFLAPEGSSSDKFLSSPPYLIGYEYSRLDTSQAAMFTELPDTELMTDLYRHPNARGIYRERYRKQFDVYALGCILLEIGLWSRLIDATTTYMDSNLGALIEKAAESNKDMQLPSLLEFEAQKLLLERLRHCTGESFVAAISLCFTSNDFGKDDKDVSLDTQQAIIEKLRQCKC